MYKSSENIWINWAESFLIRVPLYYTTFPFDIHTCNIRFRVTNFSKPTAYRKMYIYFLGNKIRSTGVSNKPLLFRSLLRYAVPQHDTYIHILFMHNVHNLRTLMRNIKCVYYTLVIRNRSFILYILYVYIQFVLRTSYRQRCTVVEIFVRTFALESVSYAY